MIECFPSLFSLLEALGPATHQLDNNAAFFSKTVTGRHNAPQHMGTAAQLRGCTNAQPLRKARAMRSPTKPLGLSFVLKVHSPLE